MTFPSGQSVATTNLSSSDADPSLAREDLYNLVTLFNQLIASANGSQGVLVLDSSSKVRAVNLPGTYSTTTGDIALQPNSGVVSLQKVLRMSQIYTADLGSVTGTTSPSAGDICYLVDGDGGRPCLGAYDGTHWRIVRFATQVGDVGAGLTATFTLSADAD